jgi:DNA-binding transcriptional regulator YiaG
MANLAVALKEEIRRLARKEVRVNTGKTKQAVARYRREIAALKRQVQEQGRRLSRLSAQSSTAAEAAPAEDDPLAGVRFSARSVRAQRRRLGLSAEQYGRLAGVSALTVYHWEQDKARPRKAQLAALVTLRGIGKKEALSRLEGTAAKPARGRKKAK